MVTIDPLRQDNELAFKSLENQGDIGCVIRHAQSETSQPEPGNLEPGLDRRNHRDKPIRLSAYCYKSYQLPRTSTITATSCRTEDISVYYSQSLQNRI